jgi:hypothetical protein
MNPIIIKSESVYIYTQALALEDRGCPYRSISLRAIFQNVRPLPNLLRNYYE